ncbi:MAG: hypothetical protein ACRBK7_18940 [Acidimicrobiales bacterium]
MADQPQTESGSQSPGAVSPAEAVAALEQQFAGITRGHDPLAWAVAAYRLGMAKAEQPVGDPRENLGTALGLFEKAAEVLTEERAPVEHARILNAAGSAHRMLGDSATSLRLFRHSSSLLAGRGVEAEEASVLSNLGVALTEAGRLDEGISAFAAAIDVLPADTDEHVRTRLATEHNLAQAHAGKGTDEGFAEAIRILERASEKAGTVDAPMHLGMVWHTLGVTHKGRHALLASHENGGAGAEVGLDLHIHIDSAIEAFERSLTVFTSVGFPFQHAIAKHNLGHALATRPDLPSLQRALVCYEDALNIFDPRLHRAHWQEAYRNADELDRRLQVLAPGAARPDHTASYAGALDEGERMAFVRQRFVQLERLPADQRLQRLTEFSYAIITQPPESFVATLRTMISVLMELPESMLQATLQAQLAAHAMLEAGERRACDFVLDEAINLLLFGPQRIRVRDILTDIGWERP